VSGPATIGMRQVAAFTGDPRAGNLAGVVTQGGETLAESQMQALAREMNLSETAFLLASKTPGADCRIRWFTPSQEVNLCGHATVASFHAAAEEGSWGLSSTGAHRIRVETLSGILPIEVDKPAGGTARVRMGLPDPEPEPLGDLAPFLDAAGLKPDQLAASQPAFRSGMYVLLALRRLADLRAVKPDMRAVAEAVASLSRPDGLILATLDTIESSSAVHLRMFAPGAGVDEDPVTGSAQGPVAGWLAAGGFFSETRSESSGRFTRTAGGRAGYVAEQGDIIGRPGRIGVELNLDEDKARDVVISGRAVTVWSRSMRVPAS